MNLTTTILRTVEIAEYLHKLDECHNKLISALPELPIDITIKILNDLATLHLDAHKRTTDLLNKLTKNNE